jgi:hypothetical protein
MDLVVVFHPPQPSGRIQACKLGSPKRALLAGGEHVQAIMGKYASEHQIIHLELPTMHKLLVVAPECLAVPCISESCLPSSFVDKVDIITPELVLRGFIVCLNMGGDHGDLWGDNIFGPYTKKKGISPMPRLEDGRLAHSAHRSSSIHLAPCFFK